MVTNGSFAIWPDDVLRKRSLKVVLRLGGYAYAGPVRSALRDSVLCLPTDGHSLRVNKLPHPPPPPPLILRTRTPVLRVYSKINKTPRSPRLAHVDRQLLSHSSAHETLCTLRFASMVSSCELGKATKHISSDNQRPQQFARVARVHIAPQRVDAVAPRHRLLPRHLHLLHQHQRLRGHRAQHHQRTDTAHRVSKSRAQRTRASQHASRSRWKQHSAPRLLLRLGHLGLGTTFVARHARRFVQDLWHLVSFGCI